jgi:hypothetical protein
VRATCHLAQDRRHGHTTFPVYQGNRDHVVGVVMSGHLQSVAGITPHRDIMTPPLVVPISQSASALETFKRTGKHCWSRTSLTASSASCLHDIMGDHRRVPSQDERSSAGQASRRRLRLGGRADRVENRPGRPRVRLRRPPADLWTFAGFIRTPRPDAIGGGLCLGRVRVEIIDMDGHRVDKVLLMRQTDPASNGGVSPR